MERTLQFSILGRFTICADDAAIDLGGPTQRAVLAYLLLNANKVVPTSHLLAAIWDSRPPVTARKMVQNSVSAIRKTLAYHTEDDPESMLATRAPGYLLQVDAECIDLHRFRGLVRLGRDELRGGAPLAARDLLRRSLDLWHGQVLADLVEAGFSWAELAAIEDERVSAYEDYFDAELAAGGHRDITPQLQVLTAAEPMRERLGQQYMIALYRSGRQVEALEIFRRTRKTLYDGLGIEPGPALQKQYRLILEHDSSLQLDRPRSA